MLRNGTPEMQAAADENDEDEALRNAEQRLEQLERAKKIGEQLQGVYEELAGIMAVSGTGVEHDFSKIVSDLRRQENELRRERNESRKDIEEKYGIDEKLDEYNSAMDAVDRLYNAKLDNLRANASEKIRDLASKYVDEQIKENRLDLSDYADKTIKQIRGQLDVLWDIYGQIQNELVLAQGEQTVAEALGEDIDSTLLSKIEMLKESLAQLGIVIENTEDESSKKLFENIRQIADSVSSLGNSFTNLGESLDNVNLSGFGEALSFVGGLTSSLMSALADPSPMGWVNFGLNVLVSVINLIADSIQQARESAEEFRLAMIDYHNSLRLMETDLNDEDYDTIFRPSGSGDYLLLLLKTPMKVYLKEGLTVTRENACILYTPGFPQHYQAVRRFCNSYLHFSSGENPAQRFRLPENRIFYPTDPQEFDVYFRRLQQEFFSSSPYREEVIHCLATELFIALSRSLSHPAAQKEEMAALYPAFQKLRLEMLSNCGQDWSLERLCKSVPIDLHRILQRTADLRHGLPERFTHPGCKPVHHLLHDRGDLCLHSLPDCASVRRHNLPHIISHSS